MYGVRRVKIYVKKKLLENRENLQIFKIWNLLSLMEYCCLKESYCMVHVNPEFSLKLSLALFGKTTFFTNLSTGNSQVSIFLNFLDNEL